MISLSALVALAVYLALMNNIKSEGKKISQESTQAVSSVQASEEENMDTGRVFQTRVRFGVGINTNK